MIQPGTLLLGKYRIERILGKGGMGVVVLAWHLHLDGPMAIKFLLPNMIEKREIVQRFLREARAAVKLRGEHVCRVFDVGTLDSGAPYIVMEYLEGVELGAFLRKHGAPSLPMSVDIMLQTCEALSEAHALGIVHRDVKPANLFLTRRTDGSSLVKLLDFGISKAITHEVDGNLTSTLATLGTPAYMSPEQLRSSKQVDARTDIWALGVLLYELLSSQSPFQAESFSALCLKVAMEPPPPLQVPLPPGFEAVVMRCLQKDATHRFQTVDELADALLPYQSAPFVRPRQRSRTGSVLELASSSIPVAHAVTGETTTISSGAGHVMSTGTQQTESGPRRWWLAAVALVLLGVIAVVTTRADEPARAVTPTSKSDPADEPTDISHPPGIEASQGAGSSEVEVIADRRVSVDKVGESSEPPGNAAGPGTTKPKVLTYVIETDPDSTDVTLDGERVGQTPFKVKLTDGESRVYGIIRRGYVKDSVELPGDAGNDRMVRVALERKTRHTHKKTRKKKTRKKKKSTTKTEKKLGVGETLGWD